jgi:hypothetical protein
MNYSLRLKQENYLEFKGILIQEITFPPCCPNWKNQIGTKNDGKGKKGPVSAMRSGEESGDDVVLMWRDVGLDGESPTAWVPLGDVNARVFDLDGGDGLLKKDGERQKTLDGKDRYS